MLIPMLLGTASVDSEITSALSTGATSATAFLVAAIAIPIAFLVFKLGKRVLGRV